MEKKENQLSELQLKLLVMMKWLHSFCVKNNIRYYCIGGTMLGAARHQGFIPWDDDIDVGIPRKDYNKLIELLAGKKVDHYTLETLDQDKKTFVYSYAKLYDLNTTLVENTKYKVKKGIYIDIFPLDGIGNSKEESLKNYKKIKTTLNLLACKVCAIRKSRSFYKNVAILLCKFIPNFILSKNKLIYKINKFGEKRNFDDCLYVSNLDGNWREKEIVKKDYFGSPTLYKFNGIDIFGVENPDGYLSCVYGEWKKLPPIEKQKTHHDYIYMNLNEPFRNI